MSRTILLLLAGVAVVGAAAILLLIAPMADIEIQEMPEVAEQQEVTDTTEPVEVPLPPAEDTSTSVAQDSTPPSRYNIDGNIASGEYSNQITTAGIDVYWGNDAQLLWVGLVAPGTGYVSIGFDPETQMEGANFIIASMHEGVLTIRDDYGFEPLAHIADTDRGGQDNVIDASGNQWPDQTVVEFIIPLDSGDIYDKALVPGGTYTVLLAYHSLLDDFSIRHTRRGTAEIELDSAP